MHLVTLRRARVSAWPRVVRLLLFAVATAVSARVSVPLPFSPVPLTLQVLVVVLSGFLLGARDGVIAQCLYLQAILLGAPVTAAGLGGPAALVSPTAGYLWAFPAAAGLAGWLSHRSPSARALWRAWVALWLWPASMPLAPSGSAALLVVWATPGGWVCCHLCLPTP